MATWITTIGAGKVKKLFEDERALVEPGLCYIELLFYSRGGPLHLLVKGIELSTILLAVTGKGFKPVGPILKLNNQLVAQFGAANLGQLLAEPIL